MGNINEDKMQHDLIMWFSQTYPELEGRLFMIHNTGYSDRQRIKLKSMGLVAGVSDLIFIGDLMAGLELKSAGSIHPREKIQRQLWWGKIIMSLGHRWIMTNDNEIAKRFIVALINNSYDAIEIQHTQLEWLKEKLRTGSKTIKF